MAKIIRCLPVHVYRDALGDCTNNGVSKFFDELLVACPDGHRTFDADVETPLNFCKVRARKLFGRIVFDIRPAAVDENGAVVDRGNKWYMMGGNFAYTSDSRFSEMLGRMGNDMYGAVAIHDRVE